MDHRARRLDVRHRPEEGMAPRHVHTRNGTAAAVCGTIIAVAENHQREDGTVRCRSRWASFGAPAAI